MKVILPIIFIKDTDENLEEDIIDANTEYYIKDIVFYEIANIHSTSFQGKNTTMIASNGDVYMCPLHRLKVEELIDMAKGIRLNTDN